MIGKIEFKAIYNSTNRRFQVEFFQEGHHYLQFMTVNEYRKFCKKLDTCFEIAGWEIKFDDGDGDGDTLAEKFRPTVVNYFRSVLNSYDIFTHPG